MKVKGSFLSIVLIAAMGFVLLTLAACNATAVPVQALVGDSADEAPLPIETGNDTDLTRVGPRASAGVDQVVEAQVGSQLLSGELTASEAEGVLYMREEEKLARDVYTTLYEKWGLAIFENIASSEATHMAAVKTLLDRYGLDDPVEGRGVGEFADEELQLLYDELVARGSQSLDEALKVGAAIEEIDIIDLQQYIAATDEGDIQRVYENLKKGSRNHLRSFVSAYTRDGQTYQPQYLSQAAYDEIVSTSIETGGKGKGRQMGRP